MEIVKPHDTCATSQHFGLSTNEALISIKVRLEFRMNGVDNVLSKRRIKEHEDGKDGTRRTRRKRSARLDNSPFDMLSDVGPSKPRAEQVAGIYLHRHKDPFEEFDRANNHYVDMASSSRASLAFAFYAYSHPFCFAHSNAQPQSDEAPTNPTTQPHPTDVAQVPSQSKANCPSYTPKRKREDSAVCELIKRRRHAMNMDNDWEMVDV
jgi:hypothetical protein